MTSLFLPLRYSITICMGGSLGNCTCVTYFHAPLRSSLVLTVTVSRWALKRRAISRQARSQLKRTFPSLRLSVMAGRLGSISSIRICFSIFEYVLRRNFGGILSGINIQRLEWRTGTKYGEKLILIEKNRKCQFTGMYKIFSFSF